MRMISLPEVSSPISKLCLAPDGRHIAVATSGHGATQLLVVQLRDDTRASPGDKVSHER